MPRPSLLVTGLILVVAILTFGSLAAQRVNIARTTTEAKVSYSPYMVTNTLTYTTTAATQYTYVKVLGSSCPSGYPIWFGGECVYYYQTVVNYYTYTQAQLSAYLVAKSSTVQYSQTMTLTNAVPAYVSIGLNDSSFGLLALLTIIILVGAIVFIIGKGSRQRKLTEFVTGRLQTRSG